MTRLIVYFFEGTSMGVLMMLHFFSFRKRQHPPLIEEEERFTIIPDEEDDADDYVNRSTMNRSINEMEDSHEAVSEQAGSDIDADEQPVS